MPSVTLLSVTVDSNNLMLTALQRCMLLYSCGNAIFHSFRYCHSLTISSI